MKYFLYLLILSCPKFVYGQVPIKGNNAIVVSGVTFSQVKESLLGAGIFISEQSAEDGTIITKRKGYCECPNKEFYQLIYFIRIKDSVAIIRGRFNVILNPSDNDENNFLEVLYWKAKNSGYHYVFGVMDAFAQSLKGTKLEYKTL